MSNYFYDMIPADELERLPYISTMGQFVVWMELQYHDLPSLSD